jgi:hypothetical protein
MVAFTDQHLLEHVGIVVRVSKHTLLPDGAGRRCRVSP